MPTSNIEKTNNELQENFGTKFWKGNLQRFGTNGNQEGIFLLPNYKIKEFWFPTAIKIIQEPFQIVLESNGKEYKMEYKHNQIILL